jgi:hypothetical protein
MALQTTAIDRQWLSTDHVVTHTDTNIRVVLQQRNSIFYVASAKLL